MREPREVVGIANAAGVVPGQRVTAIEVALPDPRQLKLIRTAPHCKMFLGFGGCIAVCPVPLCALILTSASRSETVDLADIKMKWDTVKVEDMMEIPRCFSDWDCNIASCTQSGHAIISKHSLWARLAVRRGLAAKADAGLSFPCRLQIDEVAPGSKVIGICDNTRAALLRMSPGDRVPATGQQTTT